MRETILGNNIRKVPSVAVGCMRLSEKSKDEMNHFIHAALEQGAYFFDHADIYGGGMSESVFGEAIADDPSIKREDIYLQSKCGIRQGFYDLSKEHILKSVDGILKRLHTDYLDLLLLHRPDALGHTISGKPIKPKTLGQKAYVDAIRKNMIVFGLGPAGTGKTYLAMAMAITAFKNNEVSRIILTRPAIEAGEKLGFLPGDLQSKVDPYLRPLYDALYQIMGAESFAKNMEKGLIEVAPLAYMRGRTLDNAYIILDEAQNTTPAQMKMFLTRIGFGSKVIVTGDSSQKDLPVGAKSGLDVAARVLKNIDDIAFCTLTSKDVVRHPLVQKIVKAYDDYEARTIKSKRSPR